MESAQVLVELFGGHVRMKKDLLERRFSERARGFKETVKFMEAVQAITEGRRQVRRGNGLDTMQRKLKGGRRTFVEHMAELGVQSGTRYGTEIRAVLNAFRLEEGQAWLGTEDSWGKHYAARNILLEAGAIKLDHYSGIYTINHWFYREFIKARYSHGTKPETLKGVMERQADIGAAAEKEVFEYERLIVGVRDAAKVVHIALESTGAGFDIASIRREAGTDQIRLRMIEVKAVNRRDWAFTLTSNEIRVARESKNTYFLYLVPVMKGEPTVSGMKVIQNPVEELLRGQGWTIEKGDWNIRRITGYA